MSGCGSGNISDTLSFSDTSISIDGQIVDTYLKNIKYTCGDGSSSLTDINGKFSCQDYPISFNITNLKLGTIYKLNQDLKVFPQDLVNINRTDTSNEKVIVMSQFIQSLDNDNNLSNGIEIDNNKTLLFENQINENETFDEYTALSYLTNNNITVVSKDSAEEHLAITLKEIDYIESLQLPSKISDSIETIKYPISDKTKNDLLYMGNEERLAYDVYNLLYTYYPSSEVFNNIASNSEIEHANAIKALVLKYNIDLNSSEDYIQNDLVSQSSDFQNISGEYNIKDISDLYNDLTTKGSYSNIDALEVGCIIEVTDINDLEKSILDLNESDFDMPDVKDVYNFLLTGSYNHYWAFDSALINLGINEGCCSLDEEYCHPEYPKNENKGNMDGNGKKYRFKLN